MDWRLPGGRVGVMAVPLMIALVLMALLVFKSHRVSWTPDCFIYENMVRNILAGDVSGGQGGYVIPPVHSLMVASVSRLGVEPGVAGIWLSMAMYLIVVCVGYLLGRELWGRDWALLMIPVVGLHPLLIFYGVVPLRTMLFLAFTSAIILCTIAASARTRKYLLLLIPLGIGAALVRAEGIEVPVIALALFAWTHVRARSIKWRGLLYILASCAVVVLVVLAISYRYRSSGANWSLASYIEQPVLMIKRSFNLQDHTVGEVVAQRLYASFRALRHFVDAVYVPFLLLGGIGLWTLRRSRLFSQPVHRILIYAVILFVGLRVLNSAMGFQVDRRHEALPAFIFSVYVPFGLLTIRGWLSGYLDSRAGTQAQRLRSWIRSDRIYLGLCVLFILGVTAPKVFRQRANRDLKAPFGVLPVDRTTNSLGQVQYVPVGLAVPEASPASQQARPAAF